LSFEGLSARISHALAIGGAFFAVRQLDEGRKSNALTTIISLVPALTRRREYSKIPLARGNRLQHYAWEANAGSLTHPLTK
jgi:hypothetical protein